LETLGVVTSAPLISTSIPIPTSLISVTKSAITGAGVTINTVMASSNIFQAIATVAPPGVIGMRGDHPVPRLGIAAQNSPKSTNSFYANFFLGSQTAPSWTHPYALSWAKGAGSTMSWGMVIAHIDANQKVFGPDPSADPVGYFINPNGIQSLVLSAVELGSSTIISTDSLRATSINVNILPHPGAAPAMTFPLVQGMGFITAIYTGSTPILQTGVLFRSITRSSSIPKIGVTKYNILLEDGKTWLLYAYSPSGAALEFTVVNNGLAQATSNFDGIIQIAKNPMGSAGEALYDMACGAYPTMSSLTGSVNGASASYSFSFAKGGLSSATLVMFALPHHVESFSQNTKSCITALQLQTTTKGSATMVVADSWTLLESIPVDLDFAPWSPSLGSKSTLSAAAIAAIESVATLEVSQNMTQQSNLNSMYYSGKVCSFGS
jgi:endo-1,3(4)-beta-glucanase